MRIASIFTGAMGLDIGLERQGFETAIAVENDRHAQATIKTNRPNIPILSDAFTITPKDILSNGPIDAIVGGPPCQSWSFAGKGLGLDDPRGLAIPRFLDIVIAVRPKFVVMENVMGLASALINGKKGAMLTFIFNKLSLSGYSVSINKINAVNFGTPQSRNRIIFLAHLNGPAPLMVTTHADSSIFGVPKWRTLRDAIGDYPKGEGIKYSQSQLKFFSLLKAGQNWRNLPLELQRDAMKGALKSGGGKTSYFRRLSWDKPCPTLTCSPVARINSFCHPDEDRPLNVAEYARIQQFPDDWKFEGPLMAKYRQIGNAIPIGLAEAIGKSLIQHC
jgi:DNA (cytosine-5)-methyltransferase 1